MRGARHLNAHHELPGQHPGSEFTGPVFDPSGTRFYFASQRMASPNDPANAVAGVVYEVTGPFHRLGPSGAQPATGDTPSAVPARPTVPGSDAQVAGASSPAAQDALPATGGDRRLGWLAAGAGALGWLVTRRSISGE